MSKCSINTDCSKPYTYYNKQCIYEGDCETTSQCNDAMHCDNRVCMADDSVECTVDSDCSTSDMCISDSCVPRGLTSIYSISGIESVCDAGYTTYGNLIQETSGYSTICVQYSAYNQSFTISWIDSLSIQTL
jgi:hypothetical protein